jgi:bloom syndrome protein
LNCWLKENSGINNTPLHRHHQHSTTIKQYVVPIAHLIASLLRTSNHYQYPKSTDLINALQALALNKTQEALHSVFMALWKTNWRTSKGNRMPDPTMCFLSLFSVKVTGEFQLPKDTTGVIAKLCRAIQLAMIQEIHKLVDNGVMAHQSEAMDSLACYVREKDITTFNSLMSLQHYASALSYNSMSLPCIWWLDRVNWHEMLYLGQRLTYQHIQNVFTRLEEHIIDLWENKILLGLGIQVEYSILADNLLRTESSYSFLEDQGNPFLKHRNDLGNAILNDPILRKKILVGGSLNAMAERQWLVDLAVLEGLARAWN